MQQNKYTQRRSWVLLHITEFAKKYSRIVITLCISLLFYQTLLICQTLNLFNNKIILM